MKTNNLSKISINIYLFLWCIYKLQGVIFSGASFIPQFLLIVLLLVSIYFFVKVNRKYKLPKVLNVLSIIIFVFSIYGIIRILQSEAILVTESTYRAINSWDYIKKIYISFLPVYTIYLVVKNGVFSESDLRRWAIVFFIISVISYYWNQNAALLAIQMSGRNIEEITNNAAYGIISIIILIPLFSKRPLLQYTILFVCLYHALIGMKRGALLCGVVATIWFFYASLHNTKDVKRKLLIPVLIVLVFIGVIMVFNSLSQSSDWFNTRMEKTLEGDSSNRDVLYSTFWNHFINETNPFRILFGNGADSTLKIFTNYAHNDWLEIAINNGVVMLILYFVYWMTLFRTARKAKENSICFMILNLYFILYFLKSWFSMSYGDIEISASVALGYALANSEKSKIHTDIIQQKPKY